MDNPFKWLLNQKPKIIEMTTVRQSDSSSDCSSPTLSNRSSPSKQQKLPRFLGSNIRPPLFWYLINLISFSSFYLKSLKWYFKFCKVMKQTKNWTNKINQTYCVAKLTRLLLWNLETINLKIFQLDKVR